ncbi:MAG: hypothetical protein GIX03_09800 [Candidatus Eremiobacteraeota bacterium]|nr:hypothetical protein [Candidatus Eremiobacteraeota bacterium]
MINFRFATVGKIAAAGLLLASLYAPAYAQQNTDPRGHGRLNAYGKTNNNESGLLLEDIYTRTWFCDLSVPAQSSSGCEVGASYNHPPVPPNQFDPLYITVPLGFAVPPMQMQCPNGLVCVDHPGTIDLSRIGLPGNVPTPGHDHFTTTTNQGAPEFWDVFVIGVKNRQTYDAIEAHRSFSYIEQLIKAGNPYVTKPIPTNLFLYFAVRPVGAL